MAQQSNRRSFRIIEGGKPETWMFVMLNPEQQRAVLRAINHSPKPGTTLRIWNAAISAINYDTGMIAASAAELAKYAEVHPTDARRSLADLVRIGALLRLSRGRYRINPHVAWSGPQDSREALAEATRPVLQLVHDADS